MEIFITECAKNNLKEIKQSDYNKQIYCVYGHCCNLNKKWYIGESSLIDNLEKRFGKNGWMYTRKEKRSDGKLRYKHPKFAAAIKKYSWNNFSHYILGYYKKDDIDNAEINWIKIKDSLNNGYNATNGGMHAHKLSEDDKIKISNPVIVRDKKTKDIIKIFPSMKTAAIELKIPNSTCISDCCSGKRKSAHGYIFEYLNRKSTRIKKTKNKIIGNKINGKNKVNQLNLKTKEIITSFESVVSASKITRNK